MRKTIAQVVVGLPMEGPFDYSIKAEDIDKVSVGKRVYILFNRRKRVGYVTGMIAKSEFANLNTIMSVLDETPSLDSKALQFTQEFSQYYGCSWGEAIETYLPAFLRKSKYIVEKISISPAEKSGQTSTQLLCEFDEKKMWDILQEEIDQTIKNKKGVIFLAPEVSQVKRIARKMEDLVDACVVMDKKVSAKKEKESWEKIRQGEAKLVLGTRSAIFAPVKDLGLIIISHEDDGSYKQEQSPSYHVNKVAEMRAGIEGCKVFLVSVTPSVETWFHYKGAMSKEMGKNANRAPLQIIDLSNFDGQRSSLLSPPLQNEVRASLEQNKKVLLVMNRKGFSTITSCTECGFVIQCPRCNVNLIYMSSTKTLTCTHCTHHEELPAVCPQCQHAYLRSLGVGIERMASTISKFFPEAKVDVFDKESKKVPRTADIVIATQAIFKWRDSIDFHIAVYLDFDAELNRFHFRSSHEAFAKLVQVQLLAKEKAFVQTRNPENNSIQAVVSGNHELFYSQELEYRKDLGFPPFLHMAEIIVRGVKEESVAKYAHELYALLKENAIDNIDIMEPHPDSMPKLRDQYRYNLMLKSESPAKILAVVKPSLKALKRRNIIVTINVDP